MGAQYEVKLTAWAYQDSDHFSQLGPHHDENHLTFSEKVEAKNFLEAYLNDSSIQL